MKTTVLRGACTHNLKGVDLDLYPGEVVAITGVSGAGKSSLAFDTLYAEGQRRFVESFSPYARQFLERLERPPITSLEPVPAAIAVDRRAPVKSSRSTLATMADLEAYLSALFAREALPVCPKHERTGVRRDAAGAAKEAILRHPGCRSVLTYRAVARDTEHYLGLRERLLADGYRRIFARGAVHDLDTLPPSEAVSPGGHIDVVVDRVVLAAKDERRLAASIESAWQSAGGTAHLRWDDGEETLRRGTVCPECALELPEGRAGLFSYESALGACSQCRGFGRTLGIDYGKVIPDPRLSLKQGAVRAWNGKSSARERKELERFCARRGIGFDRPWAELSGEEREAIFTGDESFKRGQFSGLRSWFQWLETRTYKMHVRVFLSRFRSYDLCTSCQGQRLTEAALQFRVGERNLADWHRLEVSAARRELDKLVTRSGQGELARRELLTRLSYLEGVGLGYLTLDRQSRTLSGGEAQRVTLTAALGTSLHHALFVLDEPSVGLHPTDTRALNVLIHELASRGNIVLVVDHDPELVGSAHRVIELGPGAGSGGGNIIRDERREGTKPARKAAEGQAKASPSSRLQKAPRASRALAERPAERTPSEFLEVRGAAEHNLAALDVDIPLGVVCAFAGPSGSGKSTLLVDIVYRGLARRFGVKDAEAPGTFRELRGGRALRGVTLVDQSPLGRTSRGNAATYTKTWDVFRALFAAEPAAASRGLTATHFSFNVAGGRCDACSGEGYETVEMQFLADVTLSCAVCQGRRFGEAVLAVLHRGQNVATLLERTIDDVLGDFADTPKVTRRLAPLGALGLGYLRLGQPLSTLSGGEAQRLKLARALSEHQQGALLVLDEPSAGLHPTEVHRLVEALETLVEAGSSVVLIDHDLELLRQVDWLIELGPGAGKEGGRVVGQGTPREVARLQTRTGSALRGENLALPLPLLARDAHRNGTVTVSRATEHNLKDISVQVPHGALTVVTGPSGSGKSSLAFDVIFAEGQRRFLETLTPYARQFLPQMPRPHVESVSGVPPSVALEQRTARAGADSTVATVTEVAHYLRLLFAKNGVPRCPGHDKPAVRLSEDELYTSAQKEKAAYTLLAPAVRARKGTHLDVFTAAFRAGIAEAFCDGERVSTDAPPRLVRSREHSIDLIVAENVPGASLIRADFARALRFGEGYVKLRARGREQLLSLVGSCPECDFSAPELDPRWFSFNTAQGRCEVCVGAGVIEEPAAPRRRVRRRLKKKASEPALVPGVCPACLGERLSPIPRAVRLEGERYPEVVARSVASALRLVDGWRFEGKALAIGGPLKDELLRRLRFLKDVGLDYLGLDRAAYTLSGGEMQRLRLAAQLGTGLTGALYVLDEPTIGLHPRDTGRLLRNLRALVDLGSTVLVVEHDVDTIVGADHLIDLGPGGGSEGGQVVAAGTPEDVLANPASPTGQAMRTPSVLRKPLPIPRTHPRLVLEGVSEHNLKNLRASVPTGRLVVVAGVSGSGKSTLVSRVLLPAVRAALGLATDPPGRFRSLQGVEQVKRAALVDQSPIGRTPRSVPATFLGIWDAMRRLFAATPDAKALGFGPERFSFNTSKGGRCSACEGQGAVSHEMSFLPDVVTPCTSCEGSRFEPRTLDIRYAGRTIADVLQLTIEEAVTVFRHHREIAAPLATLSDLGAGYITLGQSSPTLSGGEAQRLKLSRELTGGARHEPTLYVLDEPTTGLHLRDVSKLITVLSRLVDRGDSVVVIEHHPVVIASADWILELGPEAGEAGGEVVFEGSAAALRQAKTATATALRAVSGSWVVDTRGRG